MSVTAYTQIDLEVIECASCGVLFGVSPNFQRQHRNDHSGFYCPNGHSNFYYGKSEAEKLRDQLKAEQSKLANAQFELMAVEKKLKRTERRIKNGVCPCCHRQFIQLTRHMNSKHPNYVTEKA